MRGFNLQAESMARNGLPCVYVGRPTKFGNPYFIDTENRVKFVTAQGVPKFYSKYKTRADAAEGAVGVFYYWLHEILLDRPNFLDELRGKNLSCFCKESEPCHADILLEIANKQL